MSKLDKKRGLGRGLSALMSDVQLDTEGAETAPVVRDRVLPIDMIEANPNQPRKSFAIEDLADLTASVREKGIIQPIIVRPIGSDKYQVVAGERRWRAAQNAQLHEIPVVIRDLSDTEVLEVAIIENVQRADLNPIEEAQGYRQLMDSFGHTQEELAKSLGKSRSYIANLLRLMQLPEDVQTLLQENKLSIGHARALITSDNASTLAKKVVEDGLSVRATEALAKGPQEPTNKVAKQRQPKPSTKDADTKALEGDLSAAIGMHVSIDHAASGEGGKITISYKSLDQLDDLCRQLSGF